MRRVISILLVISARKAERNDTRRYYEQSSGQHSTRRTDWDRVDRMSDEDIRVAAAREPDAHLDDQAFWAQAEVLTEVGTPGTTAGSCGLRQGLTVPVRALQAAEIGPLPRASTGHKEGHSGRLGLRRDAETQGYSSRDAKSEKRSAWFIVVLPLIMTPDIGPQCATAYHRTGCGGCKLAVRYSVSASR
jgi:hypothetical protein